MPRRRPSFVIPEDPDDNYTEGSRLTRRTHSSDPPPSERHRSRDRHHAHRKRHAHSRHKKDPDDLNTTKSKKHSSKHRHRTQTREKTRHRYDDSDEDEDNDDNDNPRTRGTSERHKHHHRSQKNPSHKHSRKHKHRSKSHYNNDHEQEYFDDIHHNPRLSRRTRAAYTDDRYQEPDDDYNDQIAMHRMTRGSRSRSRSRGARHRSDNAHNSSAIWLHPDDHHRHDSDSDDRGVSRRSDRRASRSGRMRYEYERMDYRRGGEEGREVAPEMSRRHSLRTRDGFGRADEVRDHGHDDDMGDGFVGRGIGGERVGERGRSRSRSRNRNRSGLGGRGIYDGRYGGGDRGRGLGGVRGSRDDDYPEGTDLSDESRYRGPPPDGNHATPSGYPTDQHPYDLRMNAPGAAPGFVPNASAWQASQGGGFAHASHGMQAPPPYGYNVPTATGQPGGGSFAIIGGPGYRVGSAPAFHRGDFDEEDFDGRSELSDELGTAARHAALVRRVRREKYRSRRHRHGRKSRHHKHGRHRHSKHRSHRRRRGGHSYSKRHGDLARSLSEGSQQSEDLNRAEDFDENVDTEMANREYPGEEGAQGEQYDRNRYDEPFDPEGEEEQRRKIFTKRNVAKAGFLALAAIAAGLLVRKIVKKRKEKKQVEEEWSDDGEATVDENGMPIMPSFRPPPLPVPGMFSVKVPQNQAVIIERGGKYHRKLDAGNNPITPCVDKVAYCHSLKELRVPIPYQQCYARDNIPLRANGILFMKIEDPVAATYDVDNPYRTAVHLTQTCIRNEVAKMTVHEAMEERTAISDRVLDQVNDACRPWGVRCMRFELQDLELPEDMKDSMEKEAEAERQRRVKILESEAERDEAINRAEGQLQAQMRMSQARQLDIVNQAIGEAHAIEERGQAVAHAMRDVLEVIREPGGEQAMQMRIAEQFINAYSNATREPSIRPPEPNDMAANMNNAIDLLTTLGGNGNAAPIPLANLPSENPFDSISEGQAVSHGADSNGGPPNGTTGSNGHGAGTLGESEPSTPPGPRPNGNMGPRRPAVGTPAQRQHVGGARK